MENFLQKAELKACLKSNFFETRLPFAVLRFSRESPERFSGAFQFCLNLRDNLFRNCSYYTHASLTIQGQIAQNGLTNYANCVQCKYKE